jgi:hypothetical protein
MKVIVEIAADADGRLVGVVRAAGVGDGLPFSGSMELLARLEALSEGRSNGSPDKESPTASPEPADPPFEP